MNDLARAMRRWTEKKFLLLQGYLVNDAAQQFVGCVTFEDEESETREGGSSWDLMVVC